MLPALSTELSSEQGIGALASYVNPVLLLTGEFQSIPLHIVGETRTETIGFLGIIAALGVQSVVKNRKGGSL